MSATRTRKLSAEDVRSIRRLSAEDVRSIRRLSAEDVRSIRRLSADGKKRWEVAAMFNVSETAVWQIVTGRRKAHVV